jgi:alkylhydroperoxidase/carboxymuconolactone decarboxylase family protein YurZ
VPLGVLVAVPRGVVRGGDLCAVECDVPAWDRPLRDGHAIDRDDPGVAETLDGLGAGNETAGPLDRRSQRLVKLGIAIGDLAEGAVRSNVRRALAAGATPDEVRHVALLAITTTGFPTAVASLGWIEEVLA